MKEITFIFKPAQPFRLDLTVWVLRRTNKNSIDRWDGKYYKRVLVIDDCSLEMCVTEIKQKNKQLLGIEVSGKKLPKNVEERIKKYLVKILGCKINLSDFYTFAQNDKKLTSLVKRFKGFKPPRFPTIFETLINGIACQQISLNVGIILLNRLVEAFGPAFKSEDGIVYGFPSPEDLALVKIEDMRILGFSKNKAIFITELSRAVVEGHIDVEGIAGMADGEVLSYLQEIKGVGRWTAEYVLLRGLGRVHVFPGDDVGAQEKLQKWLKLKETPKYEKVKRVLAKWRPYGGLIYFHLLLEHLSQEGRINGKSNSNENFTKSAFPKKVFYHSPLDKEKKKGFSDGKPVEVFTIGHSNRPLEVFIKILHSYKVEKVVDVRTIPGSRKNPQFNRETLSEELRKAGIKYDHMPGLGGLRKASKDSVNTAWQNTSFRGFADYMQTPEFERYLTELINKVASERIAIMCSEAVPWRCHRSLIADALLIRSIKVEHIMSKTQVKTHTLIPWAKVDGMKITYPEEQEK